jgi:hypothetical protein
MLCYCVWQVTLCRSPRNDCVKSFRRVLVLQCCVAMLVVFYNPLLLRSHWANDIQNTIWMLGFAPNIVFFRVSGGFVAEKSWLACATGLSVVALPWNLSRTARARCNWGFQVTFSLLCWCCAIVFGNSWWCESFFLGQLTHPILWFTFFGWLSPMLIG